MHQHDPLLNQSCLTYGLHHLYLSVWYHLEYFYLMQDSIIFECDFVELSSWMDDSVWSRISSTDECALSLVDSMSF